MIGPGEPFVEHHSFIYGGDGGYRWRIGPDPDEVGVQILYEEFDSTEKIWKEHVNQSNAVIGWTEAALLPDAIKLVLSMNKHLQ